jgi:hypothetical protein
MKVDEADTAEAPGACHARLQASTIRRKPVDAVPVDIRAIRAQFSFPKRGRIVTNNAASTQSLRELLALYASLGPRSTEGDKNIANSHIMPRLQCPCRDHGALFPPGHGRSC